MAPPLKPSTPRKSGNPRPIKVQAGTTTAKKSSSGLWVVLIILLALGGGGYYYYDMQQAKAEQQRLAAEQAARERAEREAEAKRKAEEERRKREEAEEARRKQAEADARAKEEAERKRREAEEAERKRLEEEEARRRAEEEEAERLRRLGEQTPDEPTPEPEKPKTIYDQELLLVGGSCNTHENRELFASMVNQMIDKGEFEQFATAMATKIRACAPELIRGQKMNYNIYKNSKVLVPAMDLSLLIDVAGPETLLSLNAAPEKGERLMGEDAGKQFMHWLLDEKAQPLHNLMRAYEFNEGKPENLGYALKTLYSLWERTPEKERAKYLNLAIACSLVRPEIVKSNGHLRKQEKPSLTIQEVYDYFREMDAKKKLLTDVKKMSVSNLLYVVDVRLPRSEADWVLANLKYDRAKWGDAAYHSVPYLMERAANGKDPYKTYSLEEIRKEGGVCADRGKFSSISAKCVGLPAVYIVGDGDRGGHAWVATLVDDLSWQQAGSYGYKTGRFGNPCSGRAQHESVLLSKDKKTTDDKLAPAADGMIVSDFLSRIGCSAEARGAATYVTSAFPRLTAAWANRLKVYTADEDDMPDEATWKKLNNELTRAGQHNGELLDFASEIQSGHLLKGKSVAAQKSALNRNLKKLRRNMGDERSDLIMEGIERQAAVMVEAKDIRGLGMFYKKQLKENTGRGDLFQQLLSGYMRHLEELEASERDWATCAKDAEAAFTKGVLTNTGDHFKLSKEVAIQKQIAQAYEKAGNTRKAKKLEKTADERLKNSKERFKGDGD